MHTNKDATDYITRAIEANGTDVAKASEYDVDGIARCLRELTGTWDMATVEHDTFWKAVEMYALAQRHAQSPLVAKVVLDPDEDAYRVDIMLDEPDVHDVRGTVDVESGEEAEAWTIARQLAAKHGYRLAEPNEA